MKEALIQGVMASKASPAAKLTVIALIIEYRPLTTSNLNSILNVFKTFNNYKVLLDDFIKDGSVKLVKQRDSNAIMREHFTVDITKLETYLENM